MSKPAPEEQAEIREEKARQERGAGHDAGVAAAPAPRRAAGGSALHVYKPGQGTRVR